MIDPLFLSALAITLALAAFVLAVSSAEGVMDLETETAPETDVVIDHLYERVGYLENAVGHLEIEVDRLSYNLEQAEDLGPEAGGGTPTTEGETEPRIYPDDPVYAGWDPDAARVDRDAAREALGVGDDAETEADPQPEGGEQ